MTQQRQSSNATTVIDGTSNGVPKGVVARYSALTKILLPVLGMLAWTLWICLDTSGFPIMAFLSDDAFYYLSISRNVVEGYGFTFDGIASTNGWHPLWMLCVLPVCYLLDGDLESPVRGVLVLNGLIGVGTFTLLYRITERAVAPGWGLLACAVAVQPLILMAMLNGLETGLTLLLALCLVGYCLRTQIYRSDVSWSTSLIFGLMLGLVTLARLDSAFLLPASLIIILLSGLAGMRSWRSVITSSSLQTLGFLLLFAPYAIWNLLKFGSIMPLSGTVKSSLPALRNSLHLYGDMYIGAVLLACLLSLRVVTLVVGRRQGSSAGAWMASPLTLLTIACTMHFLHAFLFLTWGVYWWHFVLYGLGLALVCPECVDKCTIGRPWLRRPALAIGVCGSLLIAVFLSVRLLDSKYILHREWLKAAEWARSNTEEDAVFALKDAGLFGYFSSRSVINLDGKANGVVYLDCLKQGKVAEYLKDNQTRFIADVHARYRDGRYMIAIPRANQDPVYLTLYERDEVYRGGSAPAFVARLTTPQSGRFTIWEYHDSYGAPTP